VYAIVRAETSALIFAILVPMLITFVGLSMVGARLLARTECLDEVRMLIAVY
jgi:hypothetical protein